MSPSTASSPSPQDEALRSHQLASNGVALRRMAVLAALISAVVALTSYALGQSVQTLVALANLAGLAALLAIGSAEEPRAWATHLPIAFVAVESALLTVLVWPHSAPAAIALALLAPALLLCFFQLPLRHAGLLLVAFAAAAAWLWSTHPSDAWRAPAGQGGWLWPLLATAALGSGLRTLDQRRRHDFVERWRRDASLDRERDRMREEIEAARQIQLSMLPRSTPRLGWLDVSGVSMPASEVGGDYFDYFDLGGEKLGVVIGDVAGHGLASGLLLSGLRSCLFLLRDDLARPGFVLARLDEMVRHTAGRRMLVTLACATFDPGERALVIASAGHPPPLVYQASARTVRELDVPALPLGTRLPGRYGEDRVTLETGDVVLFYSDGLTETPDGKGDLYGTPRLVKVCSSAARERSALETRNSLMADLANFKGDSRRGDDVTLVVVRVR